MPVGKASRKKKVSTNGALSNQGRHEKESKPSQKSPSKGTLQKTTSIIAFIPILIIVIVSCAVYFNALFGDFVYDDKQQILDNPWIRDLKNIPTIFSKSVASFEVASVISNYYRPLMHTTYMVNYHIFGLKPWGFHLVNILFHCGVSVLVFLIIRRFLTKDKVTTFSVYLSPPFIAAMLFATHPIHTEAVTWIAGLPDVAFTFFYLLSFYLYTRSKEGLRGGYLFSVICFAFAVFFKEPALTLPVILLAYDYTFGEVKNRPLHYVKRYSPYVIIGALYLAARLYALGGIAPLKRYATLNTYQYAINAFPLFIQYLQKLLVPLNLNAFYVFHPIASILELKGVLSLIGTLVFLCLLVVAWKKKKRVAFLGLLFLLLPLLPVLYIPALGENTFTERYLYLPSVGYVFLVALFLLWAKEKFPHAAGGMTIVFAVIFGLYTVGTVDRNNVWKDNLILWSDTVNKSPDSAMAHNNLGNVYSPQGMSDSAMAEYQTALRLNPAFAEAHNNLGTEYAYRGLLDRAVAEYQTALRLKPDFVDAHNNLGAAYRSQGLLDRAVTEFQAALRLKPYYAEAHYNLGIAYVSQGLLDMAVTEFQSASRLKPDFVDAHYGLALIFIEKGNMDMARREVEVMLKIRPDLPKARQLLNDILSRGH
jgi:tetratricopeptide (TPR) repeat protein